METQNTNIKKKEWKKEEVSSFHVELFWVTTHENYKNDF